jgi:hypothetical protein
VLIMTGWSKEGMRTDSREEIRLSDGTPIYKATLTRSDGSHSVWEAHSIERIRADVPYFRSQARAIPDQEPVPPSGYKLRFKDSQGRIITDF